MFFHPRNKNLAVGALIEAMLYEVQRERSSSFELLRHLEEVADHCTLCHKCAKPCPVDIDSGEVSVLEREILMAHGYKHHAVPTRATLAYLESTSPAFNAAFRAGVVRPSGPRVVLPPPYLCCGFPAYANARTEQHGRMVLRDTIVFSQIREML